MKFIDEFKKFAIKGNVIDLAVGIVIGASFGKIVSSLVSDVLMPPIGLLVGGVDFSNLIINLKSASEGQEAVVIRYGLFLNTVIDFLIIAFAVFWLIKGVNLLKSREENKPFNPPEPPAEIKLLTEIRDLLKK